MKNLDEDIDEELIRLKFSQFGAIVSVMISKDENGISRGFGFVCFENPDSAKKAVDTMNGLQLGMKISFFTFGTKTDIDFCGVTCKKYLILLLLYKILNLFYF